ncbi:hypothetical protein [Nocardia asteroides]
MIREAGAPRWDAEAEQILTRLVTVHSDIGYLRRRVPANRAALYLVR